MLRRNIMPTMADAIWKINDDLRANAKVSLDKNDSNTYTHTRNIFAGVARADVSLGYAAIAADDPVSMLMALSFAVARPHIGYAIGLRDVIIAHDLADSAKSVVVSIDPRC
jgi:hypothetical protein